MHKPIISRTISRFISAYNQMQSKRGDKKVPRKRTSITISEKNVSISQTVWEMFIDTEIFQDEYTNFRVSERVYLEVKYQRLRKFILGKTLRFKYTIIR